MTIAGGSTIGTRDNQTAVAGSTITLSADNTYTGTTSFGNGLLTLGSASALGSSTLEPTTGVIQPSVAMTIPNPITTWT